MTTETKTPTRTQRIRAAMMDVLRASSHSAGIDRGSMWDRLYRSHGLNITQATITKHLKALESDEIVWGWADWTDHGRRRFALTKKGRGDE